MVPIFLFLNTLVTSAFIFYVVRSYLIPSLAKDMQDSIAYEDQLRENHKELLRECDILHAHIKADEQNNDVIQDKITIWAKMVQADQQQKQQTYAAHAQDLLLRARKKMEISLFSKAQKEMSMQGIMQAEQQLTSLLSNTERGQDYVQRLVSKVQKGNS